MPQEGGGIRASAGIDMRGLTLCFRQCQLAAKVHDDDTFSTAWAFHRTLGMQRGFCKLLFCARFVLNKMQTYIPLGNYFVIFVHTKPKRIVNTFVIIKVLKGV